MNPNTEAALYDFMGWLTTYDGDLVLGAKHGVVELLDLFQEWMGERGFMDNPDDIPISTWHYAEALIEAYLRPKRKKRGPPERENFGLAGLPGGSREDPESPVIRYGKIR